MVQNPRQHSLLGTWWHLSGSKDGNGRWRGERQCQEAEYAVAPGHVSGVSGKKTESCGSWRQVGTRSEGWKELGSPGKREVCITVLQGPRERCHFAKR